MKRTRQLFQIKKIIILFTQLMIFATIEIHNDLKILSIDFRKNVLHKMLRKCRKNLQR